MRSLRFIFIALITFLFVTNVVFLRRTISVLLCGILSFNSAICYSFLSDYGKADAATVPGIAITDSDDSSSSQKNKQKIAGFFSLPKIPISIPGIPGIPGGNPLEIAKTAVIKEIGEAIGVGSPLLLDQSTAYPDVSDQVKDFHPQKLTITSAEDLQKPLSPGDYSLSVIGYCTQHGIPAPGRGLPYKLAPLRGKQAPGISALLRRGTLQGIAPATLNADVWRIQAGLPLKQWSPQDQTLIHKLIPEYEKGLEGDYLKQIENTYNQYRLVPGIPSFDDMLRQTGAPGKLVLQLRQARSILADQTISAEHLFDLLYEQSGNGLPHVLPASKDSSPSPWAEIKPGIFARFTIIEGYIGKNLFEFRVTPKAIAAINNSVTVATKDLDKNLQVGEATTNTPTLGRLIGADGSTSLIGYSISRPSQALISAVPISSIPSNCGNVAATNKLPTPYPHKLGSPDYYRFRYDDFVKRNPCKEAPDYYLKFGEPNLNTFINTTYPKLTLPGRKFIDTVKRSLQVIMEALLNNNPESFGELEKSSYNFRQVAYVTHISVYCKAGWGNLPQQDRDTIIGDISWLNKYNPLNVGGIYSGLLIEYKCGSWHDLIPNWVPSWNDLKQSWSDSINIIFQGGL